jgi:hypothetical protein
LRNEAFDRGQIGKIAPEDGCLSALRPKLPCKLFRLAHGPVAVKPDRPAVLDQVDGQGASDASRGAGNEGDWD